MEKGKVGIVYQEMIEAIKYLPLEQQAKIYNTLFEYQFTGNINEEDAFVKSFVLSHKTHLDNIIKRRKSNIENGNKGGRPKTQNNPTETQQNPQQTQNNPNITDTNPTKTLNKKQEVKNKKQEINNKKENNIKEKSLAVVETTAHTPQAEVFEYFAKLYKNETNIDYLGKKIDYINLAKLVKKYGKALVIQKINWLLVGCKHSVFFFSRDISDFNISTLTTQWDRILPKLTEEQKREEAIRKKDEEDEKRVQEELAKDKIYSKGGLDGSNNERN